MSLTVTSMCSEWGTHELLQETKVSHQCLLVLMLNQGIDAKWTVHRYAAESLLRLDGISISKVMKFSSELAENILASGNL